MENGLTDGGPPPYEDEIESWRKRLRQYWEQENLDAIYWCLTRRSQRRLVDIVEESSTYLEKLFLFRAVKMGSFEKKGR